MSVQSLGRALVGFMVVGLMLMGSVSLSLLSCSSLSAQEPDSASVQSEGEEGSTSLFDGESLGDWKPIQFGGEGEVVVEDGLLVVRAGSPLTGVKWDGEVPEGEYELSLEARKTAGIDFFCGLTFPVKESHCSLIVGGWAGSVVGLSNLDGKDASHNDTTKYMSFKDDQWYSIRVRVSESKIQAWIDDEKVVDRDITNTEIGLRNEVLLCRPLGICTFETEGQYRNLKWTKVSGAAE